MTPLLEINDLTVRFGGLVAVDSASVRIAPGELRGLIGPNGAGKTTLFNAVSGLVPISAGEIAVSGQPIAQWPAHARAAMGLRRTFQAVQLAQRLTVLENVLIGLHSELKESPLRILFGRDARRSEDWAAQIRAREALAYLGIEDLALKVVGSLSFAQQRRVELARALVSRPQLLMLDEPAAGLSPDDIEQLGDLLARLRSEWKLTILLVEHVLSLVLKVSDLVTVLDNGKVIADGPPAEIAGNAAVRTAYLGESDAAAH